MHGTFSIMSFAHTGEIFLTYFTVRPDEIGRRTKEEAEAKLRSEYPNFNLRFHYGDMEYGGKRVTSREFGRLTVTPNVANEAFGGAVFGTPILVVEVYLDSQNTNFGSVGCYKAQLVARRAIRGVGNSPETAFEDFLKTVANLGYSSDRENYRVEYVNRS